MESGFSTLATIAATLFGMVLVSLVFAFTTAISRIDSIAKFSHFASWVWAAGFSSFLYFSCCFLIAFRLMEDETWIPALIGIVICITIFLMILHVLELISFRIMIKGIGLRFLRLYWVESCIPVLIFIFFEIMIWRALSQSSLMLLERAMYTALTYTLYLAALRAVVLVGSSFWSIVALHNNHY